jgi:hypothetical protein
MERWCGVLYIDVAMWHFDVAMWHFDVAMWHFVVAFFDENFSSMEIPQAKFFPQFLSELLK